MRQLLVILVAIMALLAGFYLSARHFAEPTGIAAATVSPGQLPNGDLIGTLRPDFRLGNNKGEFVTPADIEGKTLLIKFWATWCAPCRHEMPMLMDLQRKHGAEGLQVVGIALDDVQSARDFAEKYGITYPILLGAADVMDTSAEYGNLDGVLPYSVLVDRNGIIRWQYGGKIRPNDISRLLALYL